MVRFRMFYGPEKQCRLRRWEWWHPELQGKVDLSVPGEIIFYGADQAHNFKEAKALLG
jgi:hypothetical protein